MYYVLHMPSYSSHTLTKCTYVYIATHKLLTAVANVNISYAGDKRLLGRKAVLLSQLSLADNLQA